MMQYQEIRRLGENYPPLLLEIANPPERVFVRGRLPSFNLPWIAVVGTRKATEDGLQLAKKTARTLAEKGFVIVSGLAIGADTAAHEGALLCSGITVAVLGNGIDTIYPAQNENLASKILDSGGAIISEYESGTPSFPSQFLERNRIVAGLCLATIVIEAPQRSGALATARMAAEAGREVFVFPGPAGHPQWQGSHALIRDGARLVHTTEDILEDLNIQQFKTSALEVPFKPDIRLPKVPSLLSRKSASEAERARFPTGSKGHSRGLSGEASGLAGQALAFDEARAELVFDVIARSRTPLPVDKIIETTKLTSPEVNQLLSELIVYGIVEETAFGYCLKNQRPFA